MIFSIFSFAFLSRSIYDFSTKLNGNFWTTFLGLLLPLFWDFLPLFLMALFHLKQKEVKSRDLSSRGETSISDAAIPNNQDFENSTNNSHENLKTIDSLDSEVLSPEFSNMKRVILKVKEAKKENLSNSDGLLL